MSCYNAVQSQQKLLAEQEMEVHASQPGTHYFLCEHICKFSSGEVPDEILSWAVCFVAKMAGMLTRNDYLHFLNSCNCCFLHSHPDHLDGPNFWNHFYPTAPACALSGALSEGTVVEITLVH